MNELEIAPEQYEFHDSAQFDFDRRGFFKALGCGMLAVFVERWSLRNRGVAGGGVDRGRWRSALFCTLPRMER
jgi:hypothetical protein